MQAEIRKKINFSSKCFRFLAFSPFSGYFKAG